LLLEHPMGLGQVEERARRDRDDQTNRSRRQFGG